MNYSVYEIKTPDGMIYIGRTSSPESRHTKAGYESKPSIYNCFDDCEITVLFSDLNKDVADMLEHLLIRYYKSIELSLNNKGSRLANDMLNLCDGYKSSSNRAELDSVYCRVNGDLKNKFKKACIDNDESQNQAVNKLVQLYVDTNGNLTEKK